MWLRRLWRRLHEHTRDKYYPLVYLPPAQAGQHTSREVRKGETRAGPAERIEPGPGVQAERWQAR